MPSDGLDITGDADDALKAIAEVKAALASIKGKTITVNISRPDLQDDEEQP